MNCYLVQQRFDEVSKRYATRTALHFQEESISYQDLYLSSNQLARSMRRNGVKRGDRVAIILPKSINSVRAILGILKADAIYVPIDPLAPLHRILEIVEDCSPSGIMCDRSTVRTVDSLLRMNQHQSLVWFLGGQKAQGGRNGFVCMNEVEEERADEPSYSNIDTDIAYILYTSGSTGKPKGVMISHLNIYNYINWATDYFRIDKDDNILNTSHFHYDMSTFDVYCPLHTGARMTIVPEKALLFPSRIMDIIEHRNASIWKAVSSLLAYCVKLKALDPGRLKSLTRIIFSGEPLPSRYLMEWMRTYPDKEFFNAYGPTECTGISACYKIDAVPADASAQIPIGEACANSEIFLLHDGERLAQLGEVAELCIKGSCVGQGYWNDQDKTHQSFVCNPLNGKSEERMYKTGDLARELDDGNYVFVGRKDFQIKHMGHRIELGEIEYALQGVQHVRDAAVIAAKKVGDEDETIVAFVEMSGEGDLDEIREELKNRLPRHLMPAEIQIMKHIRRLQNGKIDRQYLKSYYLSEQE